MGHQVVHTGIAAYSIKIVGYSTLVCVGLQMYHHLRVLILNSNSKIILAEAEILLLTAFQGLLWGQPALLVYGCWSLGVSVPLEKAVRM